MKKTDKRLVSEGSGYVLGERTFAAITAVEGLKLNPTSRKRLASMKKRKLSGEQQRSEIILAYTDPKAR
jgi:hypothetical protein